MAELNIGNDVDNESLGNAVQVDVTISGLTATLDSYGLNITFSPGVLTALTTNPGVVNNAAGTITGITRSNVDLDFGGTLCKLYFKATGVGTAFLTIPTPSVTLTDSNGNQISFTTKEGKVFVDAPLST